MQLIDALMGAHREGDEWTHPVLFDLRLGLPEKETGGGWIAEAKEQASAPLRAVVDAWRAGPTYLKWTKLQARVRDEAEKVEKLTADAARLADAIKVTFMEDTDSTRLEEKHAKVVADLNRSKARLETISTLIPTAKLDAATELQADLFRVAGELHRQFAIELKAAQEDLEGAIHRTFAPFYVSRAAAYYTGRELPVLLAAHRPPELVEASPELPPVPPPQPYRPAEAISSRSAGHEF